MELHSRYPGVPVDLSKGDIEGAFKRIWLGIEGAELFAADIPAQKLVEIVWHEALESEEVWDAFATLYPGSRFEPRPQFPAQTSIDNGNEYKGQVRVENVRAEMCTALVTTSVSGTKIGQGDSAATRL